MALIAAALIVPGIQLAWKTDPTQTLITLVVLAVVFGVINAYIRPVLRAVSLPINLISMGLFGFFLNAGAAAAAGAGSWTSCGSRCCTSVASRRTSRRRRSPPRSLGSLVITVVSTLLSVLLPDA